MNDLKFQTKNYVESNADNPVKYLLSYGGGVNSTALAILLHQGKVPGVGDDWTAIFADTGDERDETYDYLEKWAIPFFKEIRKPLIIVTPKETVLNRWQRLSVIGNRMTRACTDHAKIRPMKRFRKENSGGLQIIGIDAGESHRKKNDGNLYPLIDMDIDRDDCIDIIKSYGFPIPIKSGCWHCPFMKVSEILELARNHPDKFSKIKQLELDSIKARPVADGTIRAQWGRKPAEYWERRALLESTQETFDLDFIESDLPCGCFDG